MEEMANMWDSVTIKHLKVMRVQAESYLKTSHSYLLMCPTNKDVLFPFQSCGLSNLMSAFQPSQQGNSGEFQTVIREIWVELKGAQP